MGRRRVGVSEMVGRAERILIALGLLAATTHARAEPALPVPKPPLPHGVALPAERPPVPEGAARPTPRPQDVAKEYFGRVAGPAPLPSRAVGFYSKGCLAGARKLAYDGAGWQIMRPSRNRYWGHPTLIAFIRDLAADAPALGWTGLLVGDLAQPRGGPMLSGHASHQIGLDADIWLTPMPDRRLSRQEREQTSAATVLDASGWRVDPTVWTDAHARLIRRAASDRRVARVFVNPAIKRALCAFAGEKGDWLRRVRPWYGHQDHFHVRLKCPAGERACRNQAAPPPGPGCGGALDWWFTEAPYRKKKRARPPAPLRIASLPAPCMEILTYSAPEGTEADAN